MNEIADVLGYIGSSLVSINLIPQIIVIIKNKSGTDVSYLTNLTNIIACIFMLVYGLNKKLIPVIISNSLILISSIIIFCLKKYYENINSNDVTNNYLGIINNVNNIEKIQTSISDLENQNNLI
jgi:MtN3 and saliva related transmembrane protein